MSSRQATTTHIISARKKSDLLEPSLIKLSSLLRYMLYETDEDKVLLEKEAWQVCKGPSFRAKTPR